VVALAFLLGAGDGGAGSLPLPPEAAVVRERLAAACPECLDAGFVVCGGEQIAFGGGFHREWLRGDPPRGYLVTWVIGPPALLHLMRTTARERVVESLTKRFAEARLIVVGEEHDVRIADRPAVEVVVPEKLHACTFGTTKPVCCCCASRCREECCEKGLGSAVVTLLWDDPDRPGRKVEYRFQPWSGTSSLAPGIVPGGRRPDLRFCLDRAGPGWLGTAPPPGQREDAGGISPTTRR
jgi:hypothetical protein